MKNVKRHIALFYVTLFILFKITGLHAYTHHADDKDVQHCEVCHITTAIGFIPLLEGESVEIPQANALFAEQKLKSKTLINAYNNKHLTSNLLTRPPPTFL